MKKRTTLLTLCVATSAILLSGCCSQQTAETAEPASPEQNPVIETIMARRSVRAYKPQPIGRDTMQLILDCGINAPNGMNAQPWEVRVVDNQDFLEGITALQMEQITPEQQSRMKGDGEMRNMFRNAPTVVFIANRSDGSGQIDCGLMGENMILAAQSLGIGSCCLGGPVAFVKSPAAAEYLSAIGFSEGYTLLYAIGFGYPDEAPEAKPRDASKVRFVDFEE